MVAGLPESVELHVSKECRERYTPVCRNVCPNPSFAVLWVLHGFSRKLYGIIEKIKGIAFFFVCFIPATLFFIDILCDAFGPLSNESRFPVFLVIGAEGIQFFNDCMRIINGAESK